PIIGVWSDRLRTRWGRRRPFDLIATPVWFVGLLILPFAESFWLTNVAMLMIGVAGAANVVITFLYNDVIPGELMGRFYAAIRFIGFGGAVLFQFLLFPMFDANPVFVLLTFSLVAFVGEMTMMLLVREGKYPEPPPRKPLLAGAKSYLKDGLGSKYICLLWLTLGVVALGAPAGNFFTLFFKNDLAMTSRDIGFMMGLGSAVAMVVILPAGWVVDKFGPNRTWGIMAFLVGLLQVMMYFFALDKISCTIIYLCYYGVNMVLAAALMPMLFSHLPKEKFGQLASFQSLLMQGVMFSSSMVLGAILSALGDAYRFVFLYAGVFYLFTPVFLVLMTRGKNPFAHMEFSMKATHGVKKEK
ncbi:MAG: MFS transporter, partial [Verrucomicrobiota bacterium]